MSAIDISLHLAPPLILLGLIIIFLRKDLTREFHLFFLYMIYVALATALRMGVESNAVAYFWSYWTTEGVYGVLALLVLREVFHRIFALTYAAYRSFQYVLPGVVVLILSLTIWETYYHPLAQGQIGRFVTVIYWFDLGVHLLEGVILLLLLALTTVFPVSWRRYEFGILAGFGVNASITMLAYLFRFEWGSRYELFFRYGPPVGYLLATLIWLHAFLRPPESLPKPPIGQEEMREIVRRYRELLERIEKALGLRRRTTCSPI